MQIDNVSVVTPFPLPSRDNAQARYTVPEAFERLIAAIAESCRGYEATEPMKFGTTFGGLPAGLWQGHVKTRRVDLPANVPEALNALYYAIGHQRMADYEDGIREGTHVLRRLANGSLSIDDLEDTSRLATPTARERSPHA